MPKAEFIPHRISEMADANLTSPADQAVLLYNNASGKWIDGASASATPGAGVIPIADGSGDIADGFLSSNVPLKNAPGTFTNQLTLSRAVGEELLAAKQGGSDILRLGVPDAAYVGFLALTPPTFNVGHDTLTSITTLSGFPAGHDHVSFNITVHDDNPDGNSNQTYGLQVKNDVSFGGTKTESRNGIWCRTQGDSYQANVLSAAGKVLAATSLGFGCDVDVSSGVGYAFQGQNNSDAYACFSAYNKGNGPASYFRSDGTTAPNAVTDWYSETLTSGTMARIRVDKTTFTGTGLLVDLASTSGDASGSWPIRVLVGGSTRWRIDGAGNPWLTNAEYWDKKGFILYGRDASNNWANLISNNTATNNYLDLRIPAASGRLRLLTQAAVEVLGVRDDGVDITGTLIGSSTLSHKTLATITATTTTTTTLGAKDARTLFVNNSGTVGAGGEVVVGAIADTTTGRYAAIGSHITANNGSGGAAGDIVVATKALAADTAMLVRARFSAAGNVVAGTEGALATDATNGFLYGPTCAGTPAGAVTDYTGKSAQVHDTTNRFLRLYNHVSNAWEYAWPQQAHIADASEAHALNAVFSDTEVEAALNALGAKVNAILAVQAATAQTAAA